MHDALRMRGTALALALFMVAVTTSCASQESSGRYSVAATTDCLRQRPENVPRGGDLLVRAAKGLAFTFGPTERAGEAAPPIAGPLGDGDVYGVEPLPVGTWIIGIEFKSPSPVYLGSAEVYLFATEKEADRLYESERSHIREFDSGINLGRVIQHSKNAVVLWQDDNNVASWMKVVSGCLQE